MLKVDALEFLAEQARKAAELKEFHPKCEPNHVYGLADSDGGIEFFDADPMPRQHTCNSIKSLVDFAKHLACSDTVSNIWCNSSGVICVLDDDTRRDQLKFPLAYSPQFQWLLNLSKNSGPAVYKQPSLVLTMRTLFRDCMGPSGQFLESIRNLNFKTYNEAAGEIQHGKSSLGKSLKTEVGMPIPVAEYVTFDVPLFSSLEFQHRENITCAVELIPASEAIQLIPMPLEIEKAIHAAEVRLVNAVQSEVCDNRVSSDGDEDSGIKIPVYYGCP